MASVVWAQTNEWRPERRDRGSNVVPSYDGWEKNPDGSFNLLFGYFNRNWEEEIYLPVGPNNQLEPGIPDQGQPTHFYPRRNWFQFKVRVPADFGKQELVWSLTVNGKTERAYATLKPELVMDNEIIQSLFQGATRNMVVNNKAPIVAIDGADITRTVKVGKALDLVATVTDDGLLKPRAARKAQQGAEPGLVPAVGLYVAWFVYRGAGERVTFKPEQIHLYTDHKIYDDGPRSPWAADWLPPPLPPDNRFPVKVTFAEPGTYVLNVEANDGGLKTTRSVTINVTS